MTFSNSVNSFTEKKIPNHAQASVSIVVVIFNMEREVKRTLHSLTSQYQKGVSEQDYQVIVVDNGSSVPLSVDYVESFGPHFKYYYIDNALPSPASAINFGVRQSSGKIVGIMIDGARILTPGVMHYARRAMHTFQNPVVSTLGWHLGPDVQTRSMMKGYNQTIEDELFESIDWPQDGYRLFEISSLAGSSQAGWFKPMTECNCLFMSRETFDRLDGYDERFSSPGGGLVNFDLFHRACDLPDSELVVMLGEGNFHQIHGGTATNVPEPQNHLLWKKWEEQYFHIRGKRYLPPVKSPEYIGHIPPQAFPWMLFSMEKVIERENSPT